MNAFSKLKTMAFLGGAVFLSASPAIAEDIEIYLYQNEGNGANILLLIDNSGATNRNFPGTEVFSGETPAKTIDEISWALKNTIQTLPDDTISFRTGVAAQLGGGDNGGAIYYPVKQVDEKVAPSGYAAASTLGGEASQIFKLSGNPLPEPFSVASWGTFDSSSATLDFPSMVDTTTNPEGNVLAVTLEGLGVPRYAQVDSAILSFTSPDTTEAKFQARVAFEKNPTPATMTDLSSLNWAPNEFDTGYNATGFISGGVIQLDVTEAVQSAIAGADWCGNQDLRLLIMSSSLTKASAPDIYTYQEDPTTEERIGPGKTELDVSWNGTRVASAPFPIKDDTDMSCVKGFELTMGGQNSDAVETSAGNYLALTDSELLLRNENTGNEKGDYVGGVRFGELAFGGNTKVTNAILSGEITSAAGSPELTIAGLLGNVAEFTVDGDIIRNTAGSQTVTEAVTTGELSVDITTIMNEIFASGSWAPGSSPGLLLKRTAGTSIGIHALDAGATNALRITMDVLAEQPDEFAAAFSRKEDMKLAVDRFANASGGGNNKPISTYVEAAQYMLGDSPFFENGFSHIDSFQTPRSNYLSPTEDFGTCGANHIIMVTHAESSGENFKDAIDKIVGSTSLGQDADGNDITCNGDTNSDAWNCGEALASFLKLQDIATHTIAFAPQKLETINGLSAIAEAGNGGAYTADNAAQLAATLSDLIGQLTTTDASMAAPGVAVNQLNRFSHLDQLYYALFRPSFRHRWEGNLKRYAVDFERKSIVDETGADAVDTDGFFKESASSWWSTEEDGSDVTKGGTQAKTLTNANRKLLTAFTSPTPSGSNTATSKGNSTSLTVLDDITDVTAANLGLPDTTPAEEVQRHLDFLLEKWGDPLHSEPRLVNYGYTGTFEEAAADASKQNNVVFVATNDGMVHGIDPETGNEYFAFIPGKELAKTASRVPPALTTTEQPDLLDSADPRRKTYGLDGGITVWRRGNTSDSSANPEHVFLYVGQRRGGESYYAIDVTSKTDPKIMWEINSSQTDFSNLGQTWSTPTLTQVSLNGVYTPVLVFGGGYSPDDHDDKSSVSAGDAKGNSVFIVNAFTGKLIWSVSAADNGDMKWAIPAPISAVDVDYDGLVDHLYAADLGGQIFRVDIDNTNTGTAGLVSGVTTFAKLGTSNSTGIANNRRFYAAPVVALNARSDGTPFLQVVIGSGYRTYPLDQQTNDWIYVMDDYDALSGNSSAAITPNDLVDVTSNNNPDFTNQRGWKLELQSNGEKVVSSAVISSGIMYVASYLPDSIFQDACNRVVGSSRVYALNVLNGNAALDFNNDGTLDRSTDIKLPGLPPTPQVLLDGSDETTLIIGTEGLAGGKLNAGKGVRKTRWFQVDSENDAKAALQN